MVPQRILIVAPLLGILAIAWARPTFVLAAEDEPVYAGGDVFAPEVIHKIEPEYPRSAREGHVVGIVVIEAVIDKQGRVTNPHVVKSIPLLDAAAMAAVQQWKYRPATRRGEAVSVYHSIALSFPPAKSETTAAGPSSSTDPYEPYDVAGDVQSPQLITKTTPPYPEEARRAGAQGSVALMAIIEADGTIQKVSVTRSIPLLDDSAVACVKQWKFKPATKDGYPVRVRWPMVVTFTLR